MSVIVSRALPDARDGLKPVHRRILWSMYDQGFRPDRSTVKCARVVGDVMARFHPTATRPSTTRLARMAQPFSLRHPLIDFKGNYGSPEDPPAAARYTECRLDSLAMRVLADIDEATVDFIDNYSGDFSEPAVLPARFPNLLVNGSQGIAVGMATNIPPHNLSEVIDAVVHLIDDPDATPDDLMETRAGPRLPHRGPDPRPARPRVRLPDGSGIREDPGPCRDRRGQGADIHSGDRTALPDQLFGAIAAQDRRTSSTAGNLDGIADVNDESSGDDTRFLITLKRDANPEVVLNNLWNTHAAPDELRDEHGRPGRRGAPHSQPARRARRLPRPSGRGHHPSFRVPPRRGSAASPHPRGPHQGARPDRRDHRDDPGPPTTGRRPVRPSWPSPTSSPRSRRTTSSI